MKLAERAARVWRHRERIEHEAAALFGGLAEDLAKSGHLDAANRAVDAAADERRHALRCCELVDALSSVPLPSEQCRHVILGPAELSPRDRMLYAAVALGCVTESLSCALLLELREKATHGLVRATVEEIVKDEIEHARIGWSVLAAEARERDVGWLARYLPAITAEAIAEDIAPMAGDDELAGLGVLPRARVDVLVSETWTSVIAPGLERYGVRVRSHVWSRPRPGV
ncbi:MAG: ferritin-like domain-containing protein [Deltaproteobacteria bacterium]|nr:ferritin-like domain-containing protein [Deltaproteobacteria bacterium]